MKPNPIVSVIVFMTVFLMVLVLLLSSIPTSSITANSFRSITWEESQDQDLKNSAPLLDCAWVDECLKKDLIPDVVFLENGKEIYVWSYRYSSDNQDGTTNTVLYVVENRTKNNSWDKLGFEYKNGGWDLGIFGGVERQNIGKYTYVKTIWYKEGVDFQPSIAYGMSDENWAIIVRPNETTSFQYKVVEKYWE